MREWTHRIYAKSPEMKRFGPLDVGRGVIVGNLIYASVFDEETGKQALEKLQAAHPEIKFELRKI